MAMATELIFDGGQFLPGPVPGLPNIAAAAVGADAAAEINHSNINQAPLLSRRQKSARGALAKIDSVYTSVHALEIMYNLLNDAHSYLQTVSYDFGQGIPTTETTEGDAVAAGVDFLKALQLPCKCLQLVIDGIDQHSAIISQAIVNSSDTKEVKYAQSKLTKRNKRIYVSQLNHRGVMERNPENVLSSSLNYAKENLDGLLSKTNPDFITENKAKTRKRKKNPGDDDAAASDQADATEGRKEQNNEYYAENESNEESTDAIIDLPRPMEGTRYSPIEAVAFISNIIENNPGKSYIRAYKEKVMAEKLVPIKKTQLNSLVHQYGGPGKPVAPLNWNERGAREAGWESLLTQFQAKQNAGGSWSIADTRNVLLAATSTADNKDKKKVPTTDTINGHHATLILLHKRRNHINEQILMQERRLRERPPPKHVIKKKDHSKNTPKRFRFDKNDTKYEGIALPPPSEGNLIYTPAEAVGHIMDFMQRVPAPGRSEVRLFKEKMMAEKIIPISISQLNCLVKVHGGRGKEPAPSCWNTKGRAEILSIEELATKVNDSQLIWDISKTCDAVWARKKEKFAKDGMSAEEIKPPDRKTVNAYHTALLSIPEIAHKVVKPVIIKMKPGPKPKNFQGV